MTPPGTVLVVDDDDAVREATAQTLELAGMSVERFAGGEDALRRIDPVFNGVVVTDIRMPGLDGLQLLKKLQAADPTIPVVLVTGHGDVATAVAALRDGADDFLTKPFAAGHLVASVQRGLDRRRLELDNRALRAMIDTAGDGRETLLGETPAMVRLREAVVRIADANVPVLVEGETGTGKELVALMLHRRSGRARERLVTVNCADVVDGGVGERLFGSDRRGDLGAIEQAHRGSLVLEDVDALDALVQPRLLRLIEEGEITRRGERDPTIVDVRVIATTRENLRAGSAAGMLDASLYYALDVVQLRVPPLRERRADIPLLFAHFVDEASARLKRAPRRMTDRVRRQLLEHDWPGNVRELRSFAFASVMGADDEGAQVGEDERLTLPQRVDRFEASAVRAALEETRGNAARAIALLGLPRKTFYDKLARHGLTVADFRR